MSPRLTKYNVSMHVRRQRRAVLALLLLCPIAAYVALPHPQDFSVPRRARPLIKCTDWVTPMSFVGDLPYRWIDQRTVLVHHFPGSSTGVDTVTGAIKPFAMATRALGTVPGLNWVSRGIAECDTSPDGKWLLISVSTPAGDEWAAAAMDGSCVRVFPTFINRVTEVMWSNDGTEFGQVLYFQRKLTIRLFRLDTGKWSDHSINDVSALTTRQQILLGEMSPGHVAIITWSAEFAGRYDLEVMNINNQAAPPRHTVLPIPRGAYVHEAELSTDGTKIAWVFSFWSMGNPVLHHLPFSVVGPGQGAREVWVCNIDGSHMHPVATSGSDMSWSGPDNVRWTRDSKSVTFIYHDTLYIAPAG